MRANDEEILLQSNTDVHSIAECVWLDEALSSQGLEFDLDSERRLAGGCHYVVLRGALVPSGQGEVVVKWISGDARAPERAWIRLMLGLNRDGQRRVQLLRSFVVEASFYRDLSNRVEGLRVPKASFVHSDPWRQRFATVMEAVPDRASETGESEGFSAENAATCLRRLAEFHASWWGVPLPAGARVWDRGGFWGGDMKRAAKLEVCDRWSDAFANHRFDPAHEALGRLLEPHVEAILAEVDSMPSPTLIHGDFKVTNLFVDTEGRGSDGEVWAIDWQWLGRGSPVVDSVLFLLTSVHADLVTKDAIRELVEREHHDQLVRSGVTGYSFDQMWSEWMWVAADFLLYVVTCKWYRMTSADVSAYADEGKDGFHLRSVDHMDRIVTLVREFLPDLGLSAPPVQYP
ncbi:MAG: phosphotransferase [Acidimicrobiia bacterium]